MWLAIASIAVAAMLVVAAELAVRGRRRGWRVDTQAWAGRQGWQIRVHPRDVPWSDAWTAWLPGFGAPLAVVDGTRAGHEIAVLLTENGDGSGATSCLVLLRSGQPYARLRRRTVTRLLTAGSKVAVGGRIAAASRAVETPFGRRYAIVEGSADAFPAGAQDAILAASVPFWTLNQRCLVATQDRWLNPTELETFVESVLPVARQLDRAG